MTADARPQPPRPGRGRPPPGPASCLRAQRAANEPLPRSGSCTSWSASRRGLHARAALHRGAEANELALRLARSYHVERGEPQRWQVISPAQAYHGPTMETLALTGRPGLQRPFDPTCQAISTFPPCTKQLDPHRRGRAGSTRRGARRGRPRERRAFYCEPISAAALPAYTPPRRFWEGLAERRQQHGFLVCFDEIVTGMGRAGEWFAGCVTPLVPDIIATAKGLGAGYAAIGAALCRQLVYDAVAAGSRRFTLGHTWDGAPLSRAVGLAVIDILRSEGLVERSRERGARLRAELGGRARGRRARVRGPRARLPPRRRVRRPAQRNVFPASRAGSGREDRRRCACERAGRPLHPADADGYAGDQSLFAPPLTSTDDELAEMVARFAASVRQVAGEAERELAAATAPVPAGERR